MIVALILGRGGNTGLPGKNVMPILGRPLMEYPILAAKNSKYCDKIFLSTDDLKIKDIGTKHNVRHILDQNIYLLRKLWQKMLMCMGIKK